MRSAKYTIEISVDDYATTHNAFMRILDQMRDITGVNEFTFNVHLDKEERKK